MLFSWTDGPGCTAAADDAWFAAAVYAAAVRRGEDDDPGTEGPAP